MKKNIVLSRLRFLPVVILVSLFSFFPKVKTAEALLPYTPEVSEDYLDLYSTQLIQDAIQLIRFQEYELALSRAKLASQLSPQIYQTWYILGTLQSQAGEVEEGIKSFEEAKKIAPEEEQADILVALGNSYFQMERYDSALEQLQLALQINSEIPQAYFDLGNTYLKLSENDKAIDAYKQAVTLEASFWPATNNIGLIRYEEGKIDEAISKWEEALTVDGDQAEPILAIAVALYGQGNQSEAIELGQKALRLNNRYGKVSFLIDNLWGEQLIADTKTFFANPAIKNLLPEESEE